MMVPWFEEVLRRAIKKAGSQRALCQILGLSHGTISYWLKSDSPNPKLENLDDLISYLGGDFTRTFIKNMPETSGEGIIISGNVTANSERWSTDSKMQIKGHESIFKRSRLWDHTHGEIVYLNVDGNSMEPDYPNRSVIACRKPSSSLEKLPESFPAISMVNGEANFKIFSYDTQSKMVILIPLNPNHAPMAFPQSMVHVHYIVVGLISPILPRPYAYFLREGDESDETPLPIVEV